METLFPVRRQKRGIQEDLSRCVPHTLVNSMTGKLPTLDLITHLPVISVSYYFRLRRKVGISRSSVLKARG